MPAPGDGGVARTTYLGANEGRLKEFIEREVRVPLRHRLGRVLSNHRIWRSRSPHLRIDGWRKLHAGPAAVSEWRVCADARKHVRR